MRCLHDYGIHEARIKDNFFEYDWGNKPYGLDSNFLPIQIYLAHMPD